jgi:hypothetical protein
MQVLRNTARHLIHEWLIETDHHRKNDQKFVMKIERWNFKNFGPGYCSLDAYFNFLNESRIERRDVPFWSELRKEVFKRDQYKCVYCGKVGGVLECDHIIPFSKGGSNDLNNLTTSCRKCNRQKKDKSVIEFKQWKSNKL